MASTLLSSTFLRTDPTSVVLLSRGGTGRSNNRKSNSSLPSRRRNVAEALHRRRFRKPLLLSIRSSSSPVSDDDPGGGPAPDVDGEVKDWGVEAALSMLRFYKREISPLLPSSCRYLPTCSEYSMEAYKKYGVAKGTVLTAWRLCRCNPLGGSGFDPPRWFDEKSQTEQ